MNEENFLQWAVVTLSGTGAEMNPGAVITYEENCGKGLSSFAVLDPACAATVPPVRSLYGWKNWV